MFQVERKADGTVVDGLLSVFEVLLCCLLCSAVIEAVWSFSLLV